MVNHSRDRRRDDRTTRDGLMQITVVLGAVAAYELARTLAEPNWAQATANAEKIVSLERSSGVFWEPDLQAAALRHVPALVETLNHFYFLGHFLVTGIFFLWLYRRSASSFLVFRDGFLAATAIALLVHWLFPTAPPRLADVGLTDTLRVLSGIDIGSPGTDALSNPVAAVPSLHAAYAIGVGIGLMLLARSRLGRLTGAIYPLLVVLTIVVTGNHFFFDAAAGIVVLGAGFLLQYIHRLLRNDRVPPPGSRFGAPPTSL